MNIRSLTILIFALLALPLFARADSPGYDVIMAGDVPVFIPVQQPQVIPVPVPNINQSAADAVQAKVNTIVTIAGIVIAGFITLVTAVGAALAVILPKLAGMKADISNLISRQDRQAVKTGALQQNQVTMALAAPPVAVVPTPVVAPHVPVPDVQAEGGFISYHLSLLVASLGLACLVFLPLVFVSCATDTGVPSKDKAGRVTNTVLVDVFNTVLEASLSYGASALGGQNGQDAAQAAFIAAGTKNGISALDTILTAYAGPQIAPVAGAALVAITQANPQTPAEKVAVLNTVGAAIQQAANQFAK